MTVESATLRVRPLVMTVGMNIVGLVSLTILTLAVIPAFYVIRRG